MMRAKPTGTTFLDAMKEAAPPATTAGAAAAAAKDALKEDEWEVRPGGMLVQRRSPDSDGPAAPVPTIRVKVKFNGVCHEIYISSQASFGELKKMMSAKTGLHHEDQKLVYKDRERDSKAFLDMCGVKDRSKMLLLEDPAAQARRLLDQRRADKAQRAAKAISRVSLDVDKLATKVSALEAIVGKGGRVVEADVVALTEALMTELVKLDAIAAEGEVKAQRRMQVREARAEVRGDAGRHPRQERGGGGAAQGQRQDRPVAAPAAAAAARVAAAAVQAAARAGERQGAYDELGDVRPAVVDAVHVLGHGDHHHGSRHDHDQRHVKRLADPAVRLGALLESWPPSIPRDGARYTH
ncbi:unnamed protein product [Alopecurus aequalis]